MKLIQTVTDRLDDPVFMKRFHGVSAIVWFIVAFPICIWLSSSIPLVVFMSVYAIVVAHFASWQAARIEVKEDERESSE